MERAKLEKRTLAWIVFISAVVGILLAVSSSGGHVKRPRYPNAQVEAGPDVRDLSASRGPLPTDDSATIKRVWHQAFRRGGPTLADDFTTATGPHVEIVLEGESRFDPEEKITTENILTATELIEELYSQKPVHVPIGEIVAPKNGLYRLEPTPEPSRYLIFSREEGGETFARFQDKNTMMIVFSLESPVRYADNYRDLDRNHFLLYSGVCEATLRVRPTHATLVTLFGASGVRQNEAFEAEDTGRSVLEWSATKGFCEQQGMALNYARDGIPYRQYRQEVGSTAFYGRRTHEALQVDEATYEKYSK